MTEKALQQACFTWFHNTYPELRGTMWMNHNQASNRKQGAILKAMGMVAGVSDLLWLHKGRLWCIELKTEDGRQSQAQKDWQRAIMAQGGVYYMVRSEVEFQHLVMKVIAIGWG
jgi:hypothetical protein